MLCELRIRCDNHFDLLPRFSNLTVPCCFFRWWWATLTLWSLPDRIMMRTRTDWKSCLSTTPEHSDQACSSSGGGSTSSTGAERSDAQLDTRPSPCCASGGGEGGRRYRSKRIHISQLPGNGLCHHQWKHSWRRRCPWDGPARNSPSLPTLSEPAAVCSKHFTPSSRASQNSFPLCNTAKRSCLMFCCFLRLQYLKR